MSSLIKLSTLTFACLLVRGDATSDVEKRDNVTLKAPIIATPSEHWEGVDGTWSTFEIRVGTAETTYRVLPITSWQETWVVYADAAGVCNTTIGVKSNCEEDRGGVFSDTKSSTWEKGDQNFLGLDDDLGYQGVGQYGFDTVGLGFTSDTGVTLTHQIVAEIVTDYWWFGSLGLGFQPTNQSGSLIFGGYDASKFTPNDVIFTMTGDNLRDIVVTIRSITSTTSSGNTILMSTSEFAFIDSAVPELWLPTEVCQAFEKAFGLTLDSSSGFYLLNGSTHDNLLQLNPNITITLANQKSGGATVDLVLPYAAFDLNATAPKIANETSFYFPIRATDDDALYTLGRTFLQETYVTTHYNSRTFNVSQVIFSDSSSPDIIALPATLPTSTTNSTSSSTRGTKPSNSETHKLAGGAIAGIVIGILVSAAFLLFCLFRRRRANRTTIQKAEYARQNPVHEIDNGRRVDPQSTSAYDEQASKLTIEVHGNDAAVEKWGIPVMMPQELEAAVPARGSCESGRQRLGTEMSGARHSGLNPIREQKTIMAEMSAAERGLGEDSPAVLGRDVVVARNAGRAREEEEKHIVSPSSDTMPSIIERARDGGVTDSVVSHNDHSPTVSEGTWTPTTPVQRRGSRFEERL